MLFNSFILFIICANLVFGYRNKQFKLTKHEISEDFECNGHKALTLQNPKQNIKSSQDKQIFMYDSQNVSFPTIKIPVVKLKDPLNDFQGIIEHAVYGRKSGEHWSNIKDETKQQLLYDDDSLAHFPTGQVMRAEVFYNKSGVHLPFAEYMHFNHMYLNITRDYMQTAVDAFAIFLTGSLEDIMRLPSDYVLNSARTIAMMIISREKLATTWLVIKGSTPTDEITYETLEKFRPLFKYINGKEMSRLNLTDDKILRYIGTHPDINRHQVGVIASRYLKLNPMWMQAKYLNIMNNLICGVPMIYMRQIPKSTYLQLTHQLFYHIRACEPLQRRFYLQMMMKTQALGKAYSWSARDVSRLGLLLTELDGPSFSVVAPEAMAGITSTVMVEMPTNTLRFVTEMQLRYIEPKALNIMVKKIMALQK